MKKYIITAGITACTMFSACGGNSQSNSTDSNNTVVADSSGNTGAGEGAPTEGSVSGGDFSQATQDTVDANAPVPQSTPSGSEQ